MIILGKNVQNVKLTVAICKCQIQDISMPNDEVLLCVGGGYVLKVRG